ncbi:helix-turn-helix transcriptional regulator [Chitinasiproducens palmae]|uniref:Regulatory protein, luxR family n=1 Tax=Chitinasiproducens palmae TaxID=1770053 RepID=A0A1H2PTV5_9BURK|nr:helix-turn-helix transcriptional regulator [Chitinasiproducens palmae]SDV50570.1 regulatory protein, luxR family [Chitinasiproducens palmae]
MIDVWDAGLPAPREPGGLGRLACSIGTDTFPAAFLDCLQANVDAAHFSVIRVAARRPSLLFAGTQHRDRHLVYRCWDAYAAQYHQHDQLFERMRRLHQTGGREPVGRLSADDIAFLPYRRAIYTENGMSERLSSYCVDTDGTPVLLNLYRHHEQGPFSDLEIASFEALGPALVRLIGGHRALREAQRATDSRAVLRGIEPTLSDREVEVCARLLDGMTHAGIAADLGVKESTVKTYRNRAFDRLGIHFRSELFALCRR